MSDEPTPTDTPDSDEEAWFDNDEGWWVSRSVARRLERGSNCFEQRVRMLKARLETDAATIRCAPA